MRKQVAYNFSKLVGDCSSRPTEVEDPYRRLSKEKLTNSNSIKTSHRIFRPTGIVRVRKDDVSSSRSSLHSASR